MTKQFFGRRTLVAALAAAALGGAVAPAHAEGAVNVYTNREPGLYSATLDEFTKATGVKVNAIFSEQGLAERIKAEGENSPADVLITVDIGRLKEAVDLGVAQPVHSELLAANIPPQFRDPDGRWFALSLRARTVYASKERVPEVTPLFRERWGAFEHIVPALAGGLLFHLLGRQCLRGHRRNRSRDHEGGGQEGVTK